MTATLGEAPPATATRVLVVDDASGLRTLLRKMLERTGRFTVIGEAEDGAEAVVLADRLQPDLVLLDLAMPVMDGLEALPRIKEVANAARVVVLSGFAASRMSAEVASLGADGYIEKTATPERMLELLAPPPPEGGPAPAARLAGAPPSLPGDDDGGGAAHPELVRARDRLAEFGALVRSTTVAVMSTDLDGTIRSWNAGAQHVFGWSEPEVVGHNIGVIVPPEREGELAGVTARVRSGQRVDDLDTVRLRKDGRLVAVALTASPVRDATGAVVGASAVIRDLSRQRQLEQLARTTEARLAALVDLAVDAIISVDEQQRIVQFNQGAERIFGWDADDVTGEPLDVLLPAALGDVHRRHVEEFAAAADVARPMGVRRGGIQGRRRDGSLFPAEASISKLASDGQTTFTVILRDVSESRAAQAELQRRNRELERSNHDLAELAYVASHDLGEPLRVVSGFARLLAEDYAARLDGPGREYLDFITSGVERMQALVADLLEYSRAGQHEATEVVDMEELAADVLAGLAGVEPGTCVRVDPLPSVTWAAVPARQVLHNLVANAVKFTLPGVEPEVRLSATGVPGGWRFEVEDHGIGVDPAYRERVFGMFQRLQRRTEYPGTGMGLAICKKVVEQRGGHVGVEATPGGGATFWFTIPVEWEQ
ncbi:MAG TPA: PAS domain S-box protein [Acidimicrobiales bacterium]|nr:PAS domain S-box protein [Acidimicrobiales bacterium]